MLASTILITASVVVTCAMRRTLVSRKARKKRIAENVDMNGDNFYARQGVVRAESPPPLNTQSGAPVVNGAPKPDQLPAFATYELKPSSVMDDEQIPLNTRTPSNRTMPSNGIRPEPSEDGYDRYGGPGRGGPGGIRGGRTAPFSGPRDEFGNPLPPSNAFGPVPAGGFQREPLDPRPRRQYSDETMSSQGSRGRGRGYPGRGYGRGGPFGLGRGSGMNGNGRGIPMGAMVAGAGAGTMAGEMGNRQGMPPIYGNTYAPQGRGVPRQYNGDMVAGRGGGMIYANDQPTTDYGQRPSHDPPSVPRGYGRYPSPDPPSASGAYRGGPSPGPPSRPGGYGGQPTADSTPAFGQYARQSSPSPPPSVPRAYGNSSEPTPAPNPLPYNADSPPPAISELQASNGPIIGQAVEMDAFTGSPSQTPLPTRPMQLRDSEADAQKQQQRESPLSLTSIYSSHE